MISLAYVHLHCLKAIVLEMKCLIDKVACKACFLPGLSFLDCSVFISFVDIPLFRYPLFSEKVEINIFVRQLAFLHPLLKICWSVRSLDTVNIRAP